MSTVPPKPKPGGLAFLIPVAIWIVFSVVATVLLVSNISRFNSIIDDFDRVRDGETATVALRGVPDGRTFDLLVAPTGERLRTVTSAELQAGLPVTLGPDGAVVLLVVPTP